MSVDPWSWGVEENSDQDWNNGWKSHDFQQNSKSAGRFGSNVANFSSNNNSQQPPIGHHVQQSGRQNQRSSGWAPQNPQANSSAEYFSNKSPLNNNPFPDVENKEIAPPDHQSTTGHRQPMKLGNKQAQMHPGAARNRQDNSSHFTNFQHGANFPLDQHQPPASAFMQQNIGSSRNPTHHYFSNTQQDLFHSNDSQSGGNSWSYFDEMPGPAPLSTSSQPQSLPPNDFFHERQSRNEPKNFSYFHIHDSRPTENSQTGLGSLDASSPHQEVSSYRIEEPLDSQKPPSAAPESTSQHPSQYHRHESLPTQDKVNQTYKHPLNNLPSQRFDDTQPPPSMTDLYNRPPTADIPQPDPTVHQERLTAQGNENSSQQGFIERTKPPVTEWTGSQLHSKTDSERPGAQVSESKLLPPPPSHLPAQPSRVDLDRPESQGQEWPPPLQNRPPDTLNTQPSAPCERPQSHDKESSLLPQDSETTETQPSVQLERVPVHNRHHPTDISTMLPRPNSGPSQHERSDRPMSHGNDWQHSERTSSLGQDCQLPQQPDRPFSHTRDWPPPQHTDRPVSHSQDWTNPPQQADRTSSQGHDWPPPQHTDRPGSQDRDRQPPQYPERPLSQGRDWANPLPPQQLDRAGSQGHDWPPPQQSERPSSQDHDRQPPQQPDRPPSHGRDWTPPQQHFDRAGSQVRDWPPQQPPQQGRKWSGSQSSDRPPSQGREWPGPYSMDRAGSQEKIGHHRTPSQGSDRSGSLGRASNVRLDNKNEVVVSRSPGAGQDRSSPPTRPDNMESLPPDPRITQQMSQLSLQPSDKMGDCPLDRNKYLETSQLSNQETTSNDTRPSRHQPSDSSLNSHRGERREVVGEAEPLGGRVVVGHTTPTATPPPNHSDEVEGHEGGSGSMERMVVGERREQSSRSNRSSRHRNHHRRESSFEEDDQDYSSDNRRGHRDDYRRDDRHRKKRGQDHRSSDYLSDEEYEIDRRAYSRRDRRGRGHEDYSPDTEYRRHYYRDDHRRAVRGGGGGERGYYRYDDDDFYRERSRPSSRSGSDYRRTNLDYNSRNQSRHFYNPSLAGMLGGREYEAHPEYFEMLRKSNPVLYACWYQEYMKKLHDTAAHSAFTQSDRASIHSGQSSGNRLHISTPNQVLDSNVGNVDSFEDYSPRLFSTPHVRGCFDGQGRLIAVNALSPLDGQQASVQLLSVEQDLDPAIKEFLDSPGPFIPGVTHKSSVLQYLRKMSDQADKGSEKLLCDLIHLIVKSNGKPDASDVSELLLESYRTSKGDGTRDQWDPDTSTPIPISHQDMLSRFRSLLHQGNKQEALDWAMRNGGWGHALFLASKMNSRTQSRVAGEFARSLAPCDPLSTLYQVMAGSIPGAATACSDRRWADWRPHLAMVLSNLTDKPSTDLTTVTTLADGLASRGRIHAAHSCYLIAQVMFGELYRSEGPVLLGWLDPSQNQSASSLDQSHLSVESFCYRSFLLTLCYEYAMKQGQPNFYIPALQIYKLLIAWRLVEWGRGREALLYCELLSSEIVHGASGSRPPMHLTDLVHLLIELSSSLKALDPLAPPSAVDLSSAPDPDWLHQLKQLAQSLPQVETEPPMPIHHVPEPANYSNFEPPQHVPLYQTVGGGFDGGYTSQMRGEEPPMLSIPEPSEPPPSSSTPAKPMPEVYPSSQKLAHQVQVQPPMQQPPTTTGLPPSAPLSYHSQPFSSQPPSFSGYEEGGISEVDHGVDAGGSVVKPAVWEPEHQPETPAQPPTKPSTNFFHTSENLLQGVGDSGKSSKAPQGSPASGAKNKAEPLSANTGGGWFGGIFGKLSKKPINRMVLPDDNDPKIVFDPKLKLWVDRESEGSDTGKELKPPPVSNPGLPLGGGTMPPSNSGMPPTGASMLPSNPGIGMPMGNPSMPPGSGPPASNMTNKYKLQKGKSMKSNYVDILSSSGTSSKVNSSMESMIPPLGPQPDPANPNYFVPQPAENSESSKGNYGSQLPGDNNYHGQLSRSSSMSSLSREVSHYMDRTRQRPPTYHHSTKMSSRPVPLYNPANFTS